MIAWRQNAPSRAVTAPLPVVIVRPRPIERAAAPKPVERPKPVLVPAPLPLPELSLCAIQDAVARRYKLEAGEMLAPSRFVRVSHPRQLAMYLARKMTDRSLVDIARAFGRNDHTTVLHAVNVVQGRFRLDAQLRADHDAIIEALGE